jgi:hypothetical protein
MPHPYMSSFTDGFLVRQRWLGPRPAPFVKAMHAVSSACSGYELAPFYELHVWAWKSNPRGAFADMNPDVTCEHAH